jgi:hypothetical protein
MRRLSQGRSAHETDPALALRQFREQVGQADVDPEPRHKALTAAA